MNPQNDDGGRDDDQQPSDTTGPGDGAAPDAATSAGSDPDGAAADSATEVIHTGAAGDAPSDPGATEDAETAVTEAGATEIVPTGTDATDVVEAGADRGSADDGSGEETDAEDSAADVAADDDADADAGEDLPEGDSELRSSDRTSSTRGSNRVGFVTAVRALSVVLLVAALVAAGYFGIAAARTQFEDQPIAELRDRSTEAAERALEYALTFDPANVEEWQERVREVMSGQAREDLEQQLGSLNEQIQAQGGSGRSLQVVNIAAAPSFLDEASEQVRVLVFIQVKAMEAGEVKGFAPMSFEVTVSKQGDAYMVTEVSPLQLYELGVDDAGVQAPAGPSEADDLIDGATAPGDETSEPAAQDDQQEGGN